MTVPEFTLEDLKAVLRAAAGDEESLNADDIIDETFEDLGYDSVSLLETAGQIEREFGVKLSDSTVTDAKTPRMLIDVVNQQLRQTAA